jgi:hypothetical protein
MTAENPVAERWKCLLGIGGWAALIVGALYTIEIVGVAATGIPPSTALGFFTLLQSNRLLGLFDLFLLDIAATAFQIPVFLALYIVLRRRNESLMGLATICAYLGIAEYFATNTAFSLLSLSDQYAAATTDQQKSLLLLLGQQLVPTTNASTSGFIAYTFVAVAGAIISFVMLRSGIFSKLTAILGIVGSVLELGPPPQFVPWQSYFTTDAVVIGIGGVLLVAWYFLIARKLSQLAQRSSP